MGCGNLSKTKNSNSIPLLIRRRISKELLRGETVSTDQGSRHSSRPNSLKVIRAKEIKCLRFQIFEDFQDLMPQELNSSAKSSVLADSLRNDIKFLKKYWILYTSALSYFELLTHGSCINDFSTSDGVIVLLISSIASNNRFNEEIIILDEPPYIHFESSHNCHKKTVKIIRAWQSLSSALTKLSLKKLETIEKLLEKFIKMRDQYSLYRPAPDEVKSIKKSQKNISKLIDCLEKLVQGVKSSHKTMKEFSSSFALRQAELESLGNEANENEYFTGEEIVHYILSK